MLTILAAVAQLELATIRERQAKGIAIAKRNGVYDRGPKLTPEQVSEARQRADSGVPKARRWPELWAWPLNDLRGRQRCGEIRAARTGTAALRNVVGM